VLDLLSAPDVLGGTVIVSLQVVNLDSSVSLFVKDAVPIAQGETHTYKFSIPQVLKSTRTVVT
jgi:hypothetical protein